MTDISALLGKVQKIEIKAKGLMNQLLSGDYHSAFRGQGMTFSEVRAYQYGDDIRNIDWNVTARTGDPYVKVFEEERELTVMLLIDMSASQSFGTGTGRKRDAIAEIAALLAFSAIANQDKVGAILFTDAVERYIPPQKGRKAMLQLILAILQHQPASKTTRIDVALDVLFYVQKKRSITFLLSDYLAPDFSASLQRCARRHDLIGVGLHDPFEFRLPSAGLIYAVDAETGESRYINTSDTRVAGQVARRYEDRVQAMKNLFTMTGSDWISLLSDQEYATIFQVFFRKRANRR